MTQQGSTSTTDALKLSHISGYMLAAAQNDASLKGPWLQDPEGGVRHLLKKYELLHGSLKDLGGTMKSLEGVDGSRHLRTRLATTEAHVEHFKGLWQQADAAYNKFRKD